MRFSPTTAIYDRGRKGRLYREIGLTKNLTLPPTVDSERIRAENRNGVLSIFLPRREETKPRKIEVKVHH